MGVYLNPGATSFRQARNTELYVDKSGLIAYLNRVVNAPQRYVCVSRPRRFGKTMAADMVCAYYDRTVDGAPEFAGLRIVEDPGFDNHRNRFDVLHINMQQFLSATHDAGKCIALLERVVVSELIDAYPDAGISQDLPLAFAMATASSKSGNQFVIVIDEWDCLMREKQGERDEQRRYLDFLRSLLKDQPYVALCYMTGILPIKKYGTHSALNMFNEFSMLGAEELAPYVGFTEVEVGDLCERFGANLLDCKAWYDGYRVAGTHGSEIEAYCPRSVVRSVETGNFRSYWNETETFEALKRYIDLDLDGLHEKVVELIAGGRVAVDTQTYANDMTTLNTADDVLTLLVHLGYLTYDASTGEVLVPNREVMGVFASSVSVGGGWGEVSRSIAESERLLDALIAGDADAVAAGVERAHEDASSIIRYNDENALACTLRLAFFSAIRRWRLVREMPAGKGFADMTLVPLASAAAGTPGVVIELKYGASAREALAQIRERGYDRALNGAAVSGNVVLCGIAYDPKTKAHSCVIERA